MLAFVAPTCLRGYKFSRTFIACSFFASILTHIVTHCDSSNTSNILLTKFLVAPVSLSPPFPTVFSCECVSVSRLDSRCSNYHISRNYHVSRTCHASRSHISCAPHVYTPFYTASYRRRPSLPQTCLALVATNIFGPGCHQHVRPSLPQTCSAFVATNIFLALAATNFP